MFKFVVDNHLLTSLHVTKGNNFYEVHLSYLDLQRTRIRLAIVIYELCFVAHIAWVNHSSFRWDCGLYVCMDIVSVVRVVH